MSVPEEAPPAGAPDPSGALSQLFSQAFDNAPLGITVISACEPTFGIFTRVNRAYCALVNYPESEIVGKFFTTFIVPEDRDREIAVLYDLLHGRIDVVRGEFRMVRSDRSVIWVRRTRSLMRDEHGAPVCFFSHLEDVSQRRADQSTLAELNARLRRSLDDAPIGMALTSIDAQTLGHFIEVNPALCRITGMSRDQLGAKAFADLLPPDRRAHATEMMRRLVAREMPRFSYHERCVRLDGSYGWIAIHASIAYDDADRPLYCITQLIDITAVKAAESKLEHLAYHDALTGLFNRQGLALEVGRRLVDVRDAARGALLLLDLDHFKYLNDTMGHSSGDAVLAKVATVLRRATPSDALIARLGGDEFLIVLPGADEDAALHAAGGVRRSIQSSIALSSESDIRATASVGIVLVEAWSAQTLEDAIAAADVALASAKAQGRNRSIVAASLNTHHAAMREQLTWSQRIHRALEENRFTLYAQPILNLRTGIVERFELLIRMIDVDGSIRPPGDFLPVAERAGMMPEIDRWVIAGAIDIAAREQRAGRPVVVEVNLSGASLTNETVAACIDWEIRSSGLDPRSLVFEITETAAIENMDEACRFAEKISALGCAFALDDFGAGFSSFYYLKYLPFSDLKIDGEFIRNLTSNASDQHIVRAIVELARGLGKSTIAEFVGDAETALLLQQYGVDYAQGYYIGAPLPWEAAREHATKPGRISDGFARRA